MLSNINHVKTRIVIDFLAQKFELRLEVTTRNKLGDVGDNHDHLNRRGDWEEVKERYTFTLGSEEHCFGFSLFYSLH